MSFFASMPCHIIPGQEFLSIRFQMVGREELPNAIAQLATPRYLQGRVAGLYSYISSGASLSGALLAGRLADLDGTPLAFIVAAVSRSSSPPSG